MRFAEKDFLTIFLLNSFYNFFDERSEENLDNHRQGAVSNLTFPFGPSS